MINNKKLKSIVTKLFIRGRKLNISVVFITQSNFTFPNDARLKKSFFHHKNFKQKRTSTKCIKSFIRY